MHTLRRRLVVAAILGSGARGLGAQAQPAPGTTITGRVTSEQGQPLYGANVYITEMNVSVGTNEAGNYRIVIPAARVSGQTVQLRVRSVGYTPQTRAVTLAAGAQTADFTLRADVTQLSAIVTTGVSAATEQIKVPFTVTRIDSAQMPVVGTNALQQLQGKVPGATIISGSGRPGASPTVMLRGPTSLNATDRDQGPLYVVDGVLVRGQLPDIAPNDIESIEVVKGAAAASLYGSRAGAGVINITTKSGSSGEDRVTYGFRTEVGGSDIEREVPLAQRHFLAMDLTGSYFCTTETSGGSPCARLVDMDVERRRVNENGQDFSSPPVSFRNDVGIARAANFQQLTGLYQTASWPTVYDPIAQVSKPSAFVNADVDMRGKVGGSTGFFASAGSSRQQGALRYLDGYQRYSGRLNIDHRFSDLVTFSAQTFYSHSTDDGGRQDQSTQSGWFSLTRTPAYVNLLTRDPQGRLYIRSNVLNQGSQNANPLYAVENDKLFIEHGRFLGGGTLRYTPVSWLELDANGGYDRSDYNTVREQDRGFRTTTSNPGTAAGQILERGGDAIAWNTSAGATARNEPTAGLRTTFGARYLFDSDYRRDANWSGQNLAVPGLITSDAAIEGFAIGSTRQTVRRQGLLGTANFDIADRYVLDFSVRRDGSSLFGADERWATFGRAATAWVASNEPWWFAPRAISTAKLRASYGTSGQGPSYAAQYETFTIGTGGTLNPATLGNRNLKPEKNKEFETGADLELFRKVGLGVTFARALIDDQILLVRPPTASGFQNQWQNAGAIENKTWEGSLSFPVVTRGSFAWSTRFLYDRTRSVIKRLDVPPYTVTITVGNPYTIFQMKEGERIGTFYGVDFVRQCNQLPSAFQAQCGGAGAQFQRNNEGYIVWTGGHSQDEGITNNLWTSQLGAASSPWGVPATWGMPMVRRDDNTSGALQLPLGNSIPDHHLAWAHNVSWKRVAGYALLDGYFGRDVWNIGYHWSLGDFMTGGQDQSGKSVKNAKPIGYWWRRGAGGPGQSSGVGGFYDVLGPNRYSVEDGSYTKLREAQMTFRVGSVGGVGNWSVGLVGRNLYTWTKFRGFDPEVGVQGNNGVPGSGLASTAGAVLGDQLNSAVITAIAGYRYPNPRTFTLQLSSSF
ncbi:MAG: SusC/RagA family TonB-linked outer membrane protein [Gemmatimonadaceae bacterium]